MTDVSRGQPGSRPSSEPSLRAATRRFFDRAIRLHGDTYRSADYFSATSFRTTRRALDRLLDDSGEGPVLDAGCGTALMTWALWGGRSAIGVDFSPRMLQTGQHRFRAVAADVASLPFPADRYAVGLSLSVIQHLEPVDGLKALEELVRVVVPGGLVVVATLNAVSVVRQRLRPKFGGTPYTMYSPAEVQRTLCAAGVEDRRWVWLCHPLGCFFTTDRLHSVAIWLAPSFAVAGVKR